MTSQTNKAEFHNIFQPILQSILAETKTYGVPDSTIERIKKCVEYNTKNERMFQSRLVPDTGRLLLDRPLTPDELIDLSILGWTIEIWKAYIYIVEDLIDGSRTRRGRPCWHLLVDGGRDGDGDGDVDREGKEEGKGRGLQALNDSCILKSLVFRVLWYYFHQSPVYNPLLDAAHEITYLTELGQDMDIAASRQMDPARWSKAEYEAIATLKCGYAAYYQPVVYALHYVDCATRRNLEQLSRILLPLEVLHQIINDVLDVFGEFEQTGKKGTDVEENKCSWVVIRALEVCDEGQRVYLRRYYGRCWEVEAEEIRAIFRSLPLVEAFGQEQMQRVDEIQTRIDALDESEGLRRCVFQNLLDYVAGLYRPITPAGVMDK